MIHISFDLETLGTGTPAPIVQIGAVAFQPEEGKVTILESFEARIDLSLSPTKYMLDSRCVEWWLTQSLEAREKVFNPTGRTSAFAVFCDFKAWIENIPKEAPLWSHSTFDAVILEAAWKHEGLGRFPHHKRFVDLRTLIRLARFDVKSLPREGVHHDALDDAVFQAGQIAACLHKLGSN